MDVDLRSWSANLLPPALPLPKIAQLKSQFTRPPPPTQMRCKVFLYVQQKHKERSPTIRLQSFTVMGTDASKQATTTTTHYAQHHCQQGHSSVAMECVHKLYKEVEVTSSKVS